MWKVGKYRKDRFKPRVLICDQRSHIANVLQEYLTSVGFHADQANSTYECLDLACLRHPDVILLDIDTPEIDGNSTMLELRRLGINVPVILISAGKEELPFDNDSAVLHKPFRAKEIAVILETLLLETKKEKRFIPRRFKVN